MATSGKSGTSSNPTGIPRAAIGTDNTAANMRAMRDNIRKYGMSKTQWRRLRHVRNI